MVPRNGRNAFLHPTPLQQFFAVPNKPPFSLRPESTGARGHYRNIHSPTACHSWWQLYNLGAIGYVAMLMSAGLCWRFQRGMPLNWCNPPCFVWKVWLFVKFLWSPMKETYIFQALLGHSDSRWEAATSNSESRAHPQAACRVLAHTKPTFGSNHPKLLPDFFLKKKEKKNIQPFRNNRDLPTRTKFSQQINSHLFITKYVPSCSLVQSRNIFHLGKLPGAEKGRHAYSSLADATGATPSNLCPFL